MIKTEDEEEIVQSRYLLDIKKIIENYEEKVRDHCQKTGKFRGVAQWSCNTNLQLTKKVPVISHNLRGYDSHLVFMSPNILM